MKMSVALFTSKFGGTYPSSRNIEGVEGYFRVSEYVEVDFPELPAESIAAIKVKILDSEIADISNKLSVLEENRHEILSSLVSCG